MNSSPEEGEVALCSFCYLPPALWSQIAHLRCEGRGNHLGLFTDTGETGAGAGIKEHTPRGAIQAEGCDQHSDLRSPSEKSRGSQRWWVLTSCLAPCQDKAHKRQAQVPTQQAKCLSSFLAAETKDAQGRQALERRVCVSKRKQARGFGSMPPAIPTLPSDAPYQRRLLSLQPGVLWPCPLPARMLSVASSSTLS